MMKQFFAVLFLCLIVCGTCFAQDDDDIRYMRMKKRAFLGALGNLTLSGHWIGSCSNATTCAVTITGSGISTGDLVIISTSSLKETIATSASPSLGTLQDAGYRSSSLNNQSQIAQYICPATAMSAGTQTITYKLTTGGLR